MLRIKENYVRILKIELEDLREDISKLMEHSKDELEERKISNYVYLENLVTLSSELLGVNNFVKMLDDLNLEDFETLDALIETLEATFRNKIKEANLVPAIYELIHRKLKKVRAYVVQDK